MTRPNKKNAKKTISSQLTQEERYKLADLKEAQKNHKKQEREDRRQETKNKFLARREAQTEKLVAAPKQEVPPPAPEPAPKQEVPPPAPEPAPKQEVPPPAPKQQEAEIALAESDDDVQIIGVTLAPQPVQSNPDLESTESESEHDGN